MKRQLIFLGILVASLGVLAVSQSKNDLSSNSHQSTKYYSANLYTPLELNRLLQQNPDKYAIIDVRTKLEYDKGHLPGAVHADYYDTEALIEAAGDKIPVTYCAFSAMRGPYAAYQLYQAGLKNASVLDGGISAWAEDIQLMDAKDPIAKSVFNHPKNIFPERPPSEYPKGKNPVEINVTAKQFEFNPRVITVEHGQEVTLHLMSLDVAHGFALPEFGIEEELLPKEPVTVTFIADRKGNFPFVCNVICGSGHDHASMVGNLIVR
jgi:cytochrome c oxidase subunit 2